METEEKYLNESTKKEFPLDILKRIKGMTARNGHTSARILASETIKNKRMADTYKGIEMVENFFGYMPKGLSETKHTIDKMLWDYAKKKLYQWSRCIYGILNHETI